MKFRRSGTLNDSLRFHDIALYVYLINRSVDENK